MLFSLKKKKIFSVCTFVKAMSGSYVFLNTLIIYLYYLVTDKWQIYYHGPFLYYDNIALGL